MKACFMGLGYIGLPTAIIAAKHGVQVTGVDINKNVVEQTNAGHLHIIEPGLEALLKEVVDAGQLPCGMDSGCGFSPPRRRWQYTWWSAYRR